MPLRPRRGMVCIAAQEDLEQIVRRMTSDLDVQVQIGNLRALELPPRGVQVGSVLTAREDPAGMEVAATGEGYESLAAVDEKQLLVMRAHELNAAVHDRMAVPENVDGVRCPLVLGVVIDAELTFCPIAEPEERPDHRAALGSALKKFPEGRALLAATVHAFVARIIELQVEVVEGVPAGQIDEVSRMDRGLHRLGHGIVRLAAVEQELNLVVPPRVRHPQRMIGNTTPIHLELFRADMLPHVDEPIARVVAGDVEGRGGLRGQAAAREPRHELGAARYPVRNLQIDAALAVGDGDLPARHLRVALEECDGVALSAAG